ncbi:MAG: suppressor of fused domain protein [Mangrovibacterium sp.]
MSQERQPEKYSESGNPIYKYEPLNRDSIEPVIGDSSTIEDIDNHISKFFEDGEVTVFHEIVSDKIHVDIYLIKANKDRDYHILMTSGMSSLPMNVPNELKGLEYAEVITLLPKNWPLDQKDFENENYYWPIRQLKELARFPHLYNSWLGEGHTITNGNPPQPMADKNSFVGVILLPSVTLPEDFLSIRTNDKTINIYSMIPLYQEEMDYKLKYGTDGLLNKFDKYGIKEIIDINRTNTCKKRFKLF